MPESDGVSPFVTSKECKLNNDRIIDKMENLEDDIRYDREANKKIMLILQGDGEPSGGLMWKVNMLMMRNQWIDKGANIVSSILVSLIVLYLSGVLHL